MKTVTSIAIIALAGATFYIAMPRTHAELRPSPVPHAAYRSEQAMEEVRFNEMRVQNDPGGAIGWRQLASAYLAAGRERDSAELASKAESAAMHSLNIRKSRNAGAAIVLADAYLEQHRFADAKEACQKALALEPNADAALRTMADIHFELGEYAQASQLLSAHPEWKQDPAGLALMARNSELNGHVEEAQDLLAKAVDLAESNYEMPAKTVSWFHVKFADLQARYGKFSQASTNYQAALNLMPNNWKALAGSARMAFSEGKWSETIAQGEKLNTIAPMSDVVGYMEVSASKLNQKEKSEQYRNQVETMNRSTIQAGTGPHPSSSKGHTHDRMFCFYLADQNRMLDLAQHAATHELASRKDIYTYDMYGWVTYKWALSRNSRPDMVEAHQALQKAVATGTQDPRILYHAGVIAMELGDKTLARTLLKKALDVSPNFDIQMVEDAQHRIAKLP